MKTISLTQPWASLMALDVKRVETRGKDFTGGYRGPVAIHASKNFPMDCRELVLDDDYFPHLRKLLLEAEDVDEELLEAARLGGFSGAGGVNEQKHFLRRLGPTKGDILPLGQVVAVGWLEGVLPQYQTALGPEGPVMLERVKRIVEDRPQEIELGAWDHGRFAYLFEDLTAIEPVAAKGALGLWEWTPTTDAGDIAERLSRARRGGR